MWANWADSDKWGMRWFFTDDYRKALFFGMYSFLVMPDYIMSTWIKCTVVSFFFATGRISFRISADNGFINHWNNVTAMWWWIAYRITAIAIILWQRNNEELKLQFRILMFSLIVEGSTLFTFLALPILPCVFKKIPWHSHLDASIAMLVFWAVVLVVGFGGNLSNVLFPCTDSEFPLCSILTWYPGDSRLWG